MLVRRGLASYWRGILMGSDLVFGVEIRLEHAVR
jgi:hypothetical protein